MSVSREWATPSAAGAFLLMAVTGIAMFFHLDTGLSKEAHEWLGWALVAGVALHVTANFHAFRRHLAGKRGRALIGAFALLTVTVFLVQPPAAERGNPAFAAADLVIATPLDAIAPLLHRDAPALADALRAAGFTVQGTQQSLADIAGPDRGDRLRALSVVMPARAGATP